MPFSLMQDIVSDAGTILTVVAFLRICTNALWRRYPAFTVFLGLQIARSLLLFHSSPFDDTYATKWALTSGAVWTAQTFACLEICALVFDQFTSTRRVADRALTWCLAIGLIVAAALAEVRFSHNPYVTGWFGTVSVVGRALTLGCALAMLGQAAMSRFFPAALSRNLMVHRWAFTAYSCVIAFSLVLTTDFDARVGQWANLLMGISTAAIAGIWAVSFRKHWESSPASSAENNDEDRRQLTCS